MNALEYRLIQDLHKKPLAGMITSALWIGILARVYGIFQIMASFRIRKLAK